MRLLDGVSSPAVGVLGFGYVGSCVAATLADRGFDVTAVDVDPLLVEEWEGGYCRFREPGLTEMVSRARSAGKLRLVTDPAALSAVDVILVTVGTPVRDDGSLADGQLRDACAKLGGHLRAGQLVVVKSTVPPGTTRRVVLPLLERGGLRAGTDFGLAFSPERLAEGAALQELRTFPIVVGGLDRASTEAVTRFWTRTLGVQIVPMDSMEAAETVKLADNWWIDLNLALANELAKFCALYGVDVLDVVKAANTIPKGNGHVNILIPSVGVGGSCLTKDPRMVRKVARDHGLDIRTAAVAREVNDGMPGYAAELVFDTLASLGKDPGSVSVAVLGLAFKNNTGDLRATPALSFVRKLRAAGAAVRLHDPLVDAGEAREMFGVRLTPTLDETVRDADCVAVLAGHREFADIDFATLPVAGQCLVFDGRAHYPKDTIAELRRLGYLYQGVGRAQIPPSAPRETASSTGLAA